MVNGRNHGANDQVEHAADDVSKNAAELGRELHHQADHAKADMVKTLYESAKTLRKQAHETGAPHEVLDRVDGVATGFEKAAGYLKRNSYGEIGEDAVHTVKRYPVQMMAIILVIGVVIGLLLRQNPAHDDSR